MKRVLGLALAAVLLVPGVARAQDVCVLVDLPDDFGYIPFDYQAGLGKCDSVVYVPVIMADHDMLEAALRATLASMPCIDASSKTSAWFPEVYAERAAECMTAGDVESPAPGPD